MVNVQYRDLGLDDRIAYINLQQAQRQGFRYRLEKSCLGKIISIFCFCCWIPRDPIERDWQKHRDYLFYNRRYDGEQGYDAWLNAVHKVNRNLPWKRLEIHNFVDQPRAHYVAPQRPVVVYQNPAPHRPPLILDNDPVFYPKKPFFQNPVRPVQGPELNVARAFNPAPNPAPLLPQRIVHVQPQNKIDNRPYVAIPGNAIPFFNRGNHRPDNARPGNVGPQIPLNMGNNRPGSVPPGLRRG